MLQVEGMKILHKDRLFLMLQDIFDGASNECNIDIVFNSDEYWNQNNEMHDLLIVYSKSPSIDAGETLH